MKDSLERIGLRALRQFATFVPLGSKYCCYCEKNSPFFMSYKGGAKNLPALMKVLDVVGSDVDNHLCPKCGSHDRERHLKLYFDALKLHTHIAGKNVLHFAPEVHFSKYIKSAKPSGYIKADLYPTAADIQRVDMLKTGFPDGEFDLLVVNHVLEHVDDIAAALGELFRILKPGGLAIFQTPYSKVLSTTFSDPGIATPQTRLQAFGQEDHVRLFGRDIADVFSSFGFINRMKRHQDVLAGFDANFHGVNAREPLFLFEKTV